MIKPERLSLPDGIIWRNGMNRFATAAAALLLAAAPVTATAHVSGTDILMWLDGIDIDGTLPESFGRGAAEGVRTGDITEAPVQNYLGDQYYYGEGVGKDLKKAEEWYRKAAEQGHAGAQFHLGFLYQHDRNDSAEAAKWYRKAADQGYARAEVSLAVMHAEGDGVPKDYGRAIALLRSAAAKGDEYGESLLGRMYYDGKGVPRDCAEAAK